MPAFVRCVRALPCSVPCSKSHCRLCRFSVAVPLTSPFRGFGANHKIGSVHLGLSAAFSPLAFCLVVFRERQRVKDNSGCGGGAHARRRRAPRAPQAPAPPACLCRFERRRRRRRRTPHAPPLPPPGVAPGAAGLGRRRCGARLRAPPGAAAAAAGRCCGRCGARSLLPPCAAVGDTGRCCGRYRALLRAPPLPLPGAAVPCRRRRTPHAPPLPPLAVGLGYLFTPPGATPIVS
jgi:hypothetical protein